MKKEDEISTPDNVSEAQVDEQKLQEEGQASDPTAELMALKGELEKCQQELAELKAKDGAKNSRKAKQQKVTLKGWEEGRGGNHSIHLGKQIVSFTDGTATIPSDLAATLRESGYIE